MIQETISYYVNNGGYVVMCMLDAAQAFDRVNLFQKVKRHENVSYIFEDSDLNVQDTWNAGMECDFNGIFAGAFIYADDITLIVPSCESIS